MPTVPIHLPCTDREAAASSLPQLLQTPLGYALLELQGTINFPDAAEAVSGSTEVGRLVFPDHSAETDGAAEGAWMKKVWLYIGYQRMTGSVQKLPKPLAVLRRQQPAAQEHGSVTDASRDHATTAFNDGTDETADELEIVEVIRWKIVFRSRPEPVGLSAD